MLKRIIELIKYRFWNRLDRRRKGRCSNCGGRKKCADWCWGPKIRTYIWTCIKYPRIAIFKAAWRFYKDELKWFGVEPWHRY